jgi:predicted Kef-type K+ transport protein
MKQHAINKNLSILAKLLMTIFNKAKLAKLLMTIFNKKMSTKLIIKKNPIKIELFGLIK